MMPTISIWMIRAALIWMVVGATLGTGMLTAQLSFVDLSGVFAYQPAHGAIMMIGWVLQLAMGVGYWMLPRYITPDGDHLRGSVKGMTLCATFLNLAVLGFLLNPIFNAFQPGISYLLLLISIFIFAAIHFKRVNNLKY